MALDTCTIYKLLFNHQPTFDSLILPLHSGSKQLNLTKNKLSSCDLMNFSKIVSAVSFSGHLILFDIQILSNCSKHKYDDSISRIIQYLKQLFLSVCGPFKKSKVIDVFNQLMNLLDFVNLEFLANFWRLFFGGYFLEYFFIDFIFFNFFEFL